MHQTPPSYRFKFLTKKLANKPNKYSVTTKQTIPSDIDEKKYNIDGIGLYCEKYP